MAAGLSRECPTGGRKHYVLETHGHHSRRGSILDPGTRLGLDRLGPAACVDRYVRRRLEKVQPIARHRPGRRGMLRDHPFFAIADGR
jgi:hypothetical protein